MQKICFFHLNDVPDFGNVFTYFRLGNKETINNPNNYRIIYESDLKYNLANLNDIFRDYSGLYALHKNHIINDDCLIIHYDTKLHTDNWLEIISKNIDKNVIFQEADIDLDINSSDLSHWIYMNIDEILLKSHGKTFLTFLKEYNIKKIPFTSQFACTKKSFDQLMEFLLPIYDYILSTEMTYRHAHVLERCWGLFLAIQGYTLKRVIEDSHLSKESYGKLYHTKVPILSIALEQSASSFHDLAKALTLLPTINTTLEKKYQETLQKYSDLVKNEKKIHDMLKSIIKEKEIEINNLKEQINIS